MSEIKGGLILDEKYDLQYQAKVALSTYLQKYPWHGFYTSTFAQPHRHPYGVLDIMRSFLRPQVERAFVVAEQHVSGLWHSHGLLYYYHQAGFDHSGDINRTGETLSRLGWSSVTDIRSANNVILYCSKYLMKDNRMEWELYGKPRIWKNEEQTFGLELLDKSTINL